MDRERLDAVLDRAFPDEQPTDELALSLATVIVQHGEVVAERYGPDTTPATTLISWSMAKSVTHALLGFLVADGLLEPDAPAPVPEWAGDGDARGAITVDQLLRMCSGLQYCEDYVDDQVSDVIEMLFGDARADMAAFAADFPLAHEPGTVFNYSSGTTNILTGIAGRILGGREAVERTLRERLFEPLGMASATPKFDDAGTFVGSSYVYATARDFARFGELYLARGTWDGHEVLPRSWVDHGWRRTELETPEDDQDYAAHWWLFDAAGRPGYAAQGYEGQRVLCVPDLDLVVCRLGKSPTEYKPALDAWLTEVVEAVAG